MYCSGEADSRVASVSAVDSFAGLVHVSLLLHFLDWVSDRWEVA
jgi:hypothetical protein